jgi:hypothetical protein
VREADSRARLAAAGTLASAGLVASHCLGPVLFLLFGTTFGALSGLSALERYRTCFIVIGFGFWGYGVYQGRSRTLLWIGLGALLLAIALPRFALLLAS